MSTVVHFSMHWLDYLLFTAVFLTSLAIGIYHSFTGGQQRTQEEYLQGAGRLGLIPVSMSILVSFISSVLILGFPAEMYAFGGQFWLFAGGHALAALLASVVFVPVFYPLQLVSINEYFMLRFKSKFVKLLGTVSSLLIQVAYAAAVFYAPSTAIEAATGFPTSGSIALGATVTILYTAIGGICAVVWTDVFQCVIMVLGLVTILVQGVLIVGGFDQIWEVDKKWGRLDVFDFNPDPTQRFSFWSLVFGAGIALSGVYGTSQMSMQRYTALKTQTQAKVAVLSVIPGTMILTTLACLVGLVIFAFYTIQGCDPLRAGYIDNPNQLVPYFIMETLNYPGIPGLFLAAIASGSLSSASSCLNSAAANFWEDILRQFLPTVPNDKSTWIIKALVVMFGILALGLSFMYQTLGGTISQAITSFASATTGPVMGLFLLGIFFTRCNKKAVSVAAIVGFTVGIWLTFGSYSINKHLEVLPTTTEGCHDVHTVVSNGNGSMMQSKMELQLSTTHPYTPIHIQMDNNDTQITGFQKLYTISYLWYGDIGLFITLTLGIILSLLFGSDDNKDALDPRLLHPLLRTGRLEQNRLEQDRLEQKGKQLETTQI